MQAARDGAQLREVLLRVGAVGAAVERHPVPPVGGGEAAVAVVRHRVRRAAVAPGTRVDVASGDLQRGAVDPGDDPVQRAPLEDAMGSRASTAAVPVAPAHRTGRQGAEVRPLEKCARRMRERVVRVVQAPARGDVEAHGVPPGRPRGRGEAGAAPRGRGESWSRRRGVRRRGARASARGEAPEQDGARRGEGCADGGRDCPAGTSHSRATPPPLGRAGAPSAPSRSGGQSVGAAPPTFRDPRRCSWTAREDRGFEPLRLLHQHDFQSCALGH